MTKLEILKAARALIENKQERFICCAISEVASNARASGDKDAWNNRIDLIRMIHLRVNFGVVDQWLEYVAKVPAKLLTLKATREYRLRWLDALIAEEHEAEVAALMALWEHGKY